MKYLLIFLCLFFIKPCIAKIFESKRNKNASLCVLDPKIAWVQPNIYYCNFTLCCPDHGKPRCCEPNGIPIKRWLISSISPVFVFSIIIFLIWAYLGAPRRKGSDEETKIFRRILLPPYDMRIPDPIFNQNRKTRKVIVYRL